MVVSFVFGKTKGLPSAESHRKINPGKPRPGGRNDRSQVSDISLAEFERVYAERFVPSYGHWRAIVADTVARFLRCGDLHKGFARGDLFLCGSNDRLQCGPMNATTATMQAARPVARGFCLGGTQRSAHRQDGLRAPVGEMASNQRRREAARIKIPIR